MENLGKYKAYVLLGKSGSGKGTQSKFLAEKTEYGVFSTGDRLRGIAKENTPLGKQIADVMNRGGFVPYWLATYLFQEAVMKLQPGEGVVFEGAARKKPEAQVLCEMLEWLGLPYLAVHIQVSDEEIMQRLLKRRELEGREDDTEEAIKGRLNEFQKEVIPAMEVFRQSGSLIEVNGEQSPEAVFEEILTKIEEK